MPTSSADPAKLTLYAANGVALLAALHPRSTALSEALTALGSSGGGHVPGVGDVHTAFADLLDDWQRLDEFCGEVAAGFLRADADPDAGDGPGAGPDQGPIYTEHGDIGAGSDEVREGETDVNERR